MASSVYNAKRAAGVVMHAEQRLAAQQPDLALARGEPDGNP
jgi:hypothetical protein